MLKKTYFLGERRSFPFECLSVCMNAGEIWRAAMSNYEIQSLNQTQTQCSNSLSFAAGNWKGLTVLDELTSLLPSALCTLPIASCQANIGECLASPTTSEWENRPVYADKEKGNTYSREIQCDGGVKIIQIKAALCVSSIISISSPEIVPFVISGRIYDKKQYLFSKFVCLSRPMPVRLHRMNSLHSVYSILLHIII